MWLGLEQLEPVHRIVHCATMTTYPKVEPVTYMKLSHSSNSGSFLGLPLLRTSEQLQFSPLGWNFGARAPVKVKFRWYVAWSSLLPEELFFA